MLLLELAYTAVATPPKDGIIPAAENIATEITQWGLFIAAICTFVVTLIVIVGTIVWQAGNIRTEMVAALAAHRKEIDDAIATLRKDFEEQVRKRDLQLQQLVSDLSKQFGETISALKEKITQVEFFIRDRYVSKETFTLVTDRFMAEIRTLGTELGARQLRLETKFDSIFIRFKGPSDPPQVPP